jgi:hypothetical protein
VARRARVAALAVAVAYAELAAFASAQTYETLHVRRFTMSVDRTTVEVGEPFHLSIAAHVDEPVTQLDNLTLPDLSGFDSLGDERRCVATSAGSDCVETLTLAATVAGVRTIAGATLDAIDARTGKPSRFTSDPVTVTVTGTAFLDPLRGLVSGLLFAAVRAFLIVIFVAAFAFAVVWSISMWRKPAPRPRVAVSPRVPPAAPAPPPDPNAALRALADALAHEPTRANALRLRQAMRATMDARDDETFGDLARRGAAEPPRLAALGAVERAAFCEDERVPDAVREALPSLNF